MQEYTLRSEHATTVALDQHARSVTLAALDLHTGETRAGRLTDCPSAEAIVDWSKWATMEAPDAMRRLEEGFNDAMTVMALPRDMRRCTRTSNYLERLNREVKRRSRVVGIFPNAASATRLMGALLMEENERWSTMSRIYYSTACRELEKKAGALVALARRQQDLRKAA